MDYADFKDLKGGPMGDLDNLVARHGALIESLASRASEDRALNEARFRLFDDKLNSVDGKLDQLLDAQRVAAALRAETEDRQARRAKSLVTWASMFSAGIVVIFSEAVRWWVRKHGL